MSIQNFFYLVFYNAYKFFREFYLNHLRNTHRTLETSMLYIKNGNKTHYIARSKMKFSECILQVLQLIPISVGIAGFNNYHYLLLDFINFSLSWK